MVVGGRGVIDYGFEMEAFILGGWNYLVLEYSTKY